MTPSEDQTRYPVVISNQVNLLSITLVSTVTEFNFACSLSKVCYLLVTYKIVHHLKKANLM